MKRRQAKRVMTSLTIYRRSTLWRAGQRLGFHVAPMQRLVKRMAYAVLWREPKRDWARRGRALAIAQTTLWRQMRRAFRRWLRTPQERRERFYDFCKRQEAAAVAVVVYKGEEALG